MRPIVRETNFSDLTLKGRGKVRDIYDLGEQLLIVATDRISAFDVIMPNPIPEKGRILNQISRFWFENTEDIVVNHMIATRVEEFPKVCRRYQEILEGRSMLVSKAQTLPVECVVRGYLSGSGWKEYSNTGEICGIQLPRGLQESSKLQEPIFTPATKEELGAHDENIPFEQVVDKIGRDMAEKVRDLSIAIYLKARDLADERGIIIADTKFEFGLLGDTLILIDEILTPDSSRFWPKDEYAPGRPQQSFDKQFLRDYLLTLDWDKTPPAPDLPPEIVEKTRERYLEAYRRLVGGSPC
ncbi:MAG: phosphoribosylaminoimidazolesuccinocarboxamide synthase [Proteobacteria bacterium]|nr:phosphoribosylaminoimidazolesuccinocarboxamide synthase [Pseudomonadota bacterium]NIS71580.1 phosphoribosylaminoimidazolesuccinocarboxamide synthase [Pseudomonadota bacterium]